MATLPREPGTLTIASFDATLGAGLRECRLDSLSFIDAYGLVGIATAIRAGLAGGEKVAVTAPARTGMREHLAAMGFDDFLRQIGHPALEAEAEAMESSGVVVPLRSAADAGGEQAISQLLWDQLREQVDPAPTGNDCRAQPAAVPWQLRCCTHRPPSTPARASRRAS